MPAYNAAAHVEQVVERIPPEVWNRLIHLWVVNDGSTDNTREVLERIEGRYHEIRSIHFCRNKGYGAAVKAGLDSCRNDGCDLAVCLHADGQYAPEVIPNAIALMEGNGYDILQGSRIASGTALTGGMPLYKFLANRGLTFFENLVFRLSMTDYHSGYMFYSAHALSTIPFGELSGSFDFDLEVIASVRARGMKIGEFPIPTRYAEEKSHVNSVPYGLRCVRVMIRYLLGAYKG